MTKVELRWPGALAAEHQRDVVFAAGSGEL